MNPNSHATSSQPGQNESMIGKVVLITGGTSGIGKATALGLARRGATLILAGRNLQRCREAVDEIKRATGNSNINYLTGDLASQKEIRCLAREFGERQSRLDVLINNAGGLFMRRLLSADGIEMTFALNHLACFLLTNLLLDLLKASPGSRIVNVSSIAHKFARIDFSNLQAHGWGGYERSKLANLLFTYELSRRLEGTGVTANALHPGLVDSNFGMNNPGLFRLLKPIFNLFSINTEEGAKTSIYLASSPEVQGITGKYFVRCREKRSSRASYSKETSARLWQISAEMTGLNM